MNNMKFALAKELSSLVLIIKSTSKSYLYKAPGVIQMYFTRNWDYSTKGNSVNIFVF